MAAKVTPPISPLRRALAESRLRDVDVAEALGVDPKTVQRWLAGRLPQPGTAGDWRISFSDTNMICGHN